MCIKIYRYKMDVEIIRSGKRKKTISAREVDGVIAHLKVPGHGPEFWKLVKGI